MNQRRCERTWQAEAREDGRLDKRDLLSFERHAAHCADCMAEIAVLRGITQKMAALPEPERTDLEHRRARQELLRRANEQFLADKPAAKPWKMWSLAGAVALGLSIFFWQRTDRTAKAPAFDIVDMAQAVWQTETIASTSRVKLQSGQAAFHVEHVQKDAHFYVEMPDGHIEVRGTRFVVDVVEGKTRSVVVTEGIVWLDVPAFHGLLHAGERWPALEKAAQNSPMNPDVSANTPRAPENQEKPVGETNASALGSAPVSSAKANAIATQEVPTAVPSAQEKSTSAITNPEPKEEPGPRFAEAMAAFTSGDDARADQLFAAFVRDFPRDGRAEDATFLRAKARARRGDNAGAAAIARDYLRAFPRGLRRPEMERLAGETK